jgi:predicted RNA-binding protein with PIN domain
MRLLIDGYNLMHAVNLPPGKLVPQTLRKLRLRFLNALADALGPIDSHQAVVVFDAATSPEHLPHEMQHKGVTVIFAAADENADARIERLIAQHSVPKNLTVVSSDHRVRQAGARRKAIVLGADEFWSRIHAPKKDKTAPAAHSVEPHKQESLTPEESAYWLETFQDVEEAPAAEQALGGTGFVPTEDEIARIEREVAEEP